MHYETEAGHVRDLVIFSCGVVVEQIKHGSAASVVLSQVLACLAVHERSSESADLCGCYCDDRPEVRARSEFPNF